MGVEMGSCAPWQPFFRCISQQGPPQPRDLRHFLRLQSWKLGVKGDRGCLQRPLFVLKMAICAHMASAQCMSLVSALQTSISHVGLAPTLMISLFYLSYLHRGSISHKVTWLGGGQDVGPSREALWKPSSCAVGKQQARMATTTLVALAQLPYSPDSCQASLK